MSLEQSGDETRISIGQGSTGRALVWLFWLLLPLLFGGAVALLLDPLMGLGAGGMATLFVLMIFGISKLMGQKGDTSTSIRFDRATIRIIRPEIKSLAVERMAREMIVKAGGGELLEAQPSRDSLPLASVEQIRVDDYVSHSEHGDSSGPTYHPRLLIESEQGRIEYIASQFDGKKLLWVRDYLRYRLTAAR